MQDVHNQSAFLILKAAYLYYIDSQSQKEIARQLGVSVTTVSRLLKTAKQEKIIDFVIRDPLLDCIHLEKALQKTFGLKEVIIAPGLSDDETADEEAREENAKKLVALEGARYLQRIIKAGDVLGISWGSTIWHMINYLNPSQRVDATFVTLHGSIAAGNADWDVRTLVTRLSGAFAGTNHTLYTRALMSSREAADVIREEPSFRQIFRVYDRTNIAVCGMGSFYPEARTILSTPVYMPGKDVQKLKKQGVMGDIALRFFDREGKECDTDISDRTIAISLDQYKKIPKKVVLASGTWKAHTLLAALNGHLIDVLITDYALGSEVLTLHAAETGV